MSIREHTDALTSPADATLDLRVHPKPAPTAIQAVYPHNVGRYRALEMIARGGMGVVLRAYDAILDREVALKMLSPEIEPDSESGKRFAGEPRVASRLHHSGIIPIYDAGELPDGRPYFTMPFLQGQSLAAHLSKRRDFQVGLMRWLEVFERLCQAMAYAHARGIVHRDLKPGNIMIGEAGEVIVMDWGLAAEREAKPLTSEASYWVFGTPAYMPPEQAKGSIAADPRTDVFGLGAILCEILTGHPPYVGADVGSVTRLAVAGDQAETEARLRESPVEQSLVRLVRRCLAIDPNHRPADAAEVARAIGQKWRRQIKRREMKRRAKAILMAALALGVSAIVGAFTAREIHAGSPRTGPSLTPIKVPSSAHP